MRRGNYYQHENTTDLIVLVMRAIKVPRGGKFKVAYHFKSAVDGKPIPHGITEEIFVATKDLSKWKYYTFPAPPAG